MDIVIFVLLGFVGGWLGKKTRLPGGTVVGALLFSGLGNAFFPPVALPPGYLFTLQCITGCVVGVTITRAVLRDLYSALAAILCNGALLIFGAVGIAALVGWAAGWDLGTAWLSTSPGRMPDMIIYADAVGADAAVIAAAHVLRMLSVLICTPFILKTQSRLLRRQSRDRAGCEERQAEQDKHKGAQ